MNTNNNIGSGSGDGDGDGSGYGDGYGYGYGDGYGYGSGYGSGDGLKQYNGDTVFCIDNIPTIIDKSHGNIAKGRIIKNDLTTKPCFIVKQENYFAHGTTLKEAYADVLDKVFNSMSEDDRIKAFIEVHQKDKLYPNTDFYDWHNKLTGSCDFGRKSFAENHNIDLNGNMTVQDFIELTENDYRGGVIKKLKEFY